MRRVEIAAVLASVVVLWGVQGMSPAIPAVRAEFDLGLSAISLYTAVYVIAAAVAAFPLSSIADRFGSRPVLSASLIAFGLGGLVAALVPTWELVLVSRAVQGGAFGTVLAVTIAMVAVSSDPVAIARSQRTRIIAMSAGEAVLPIMVGVILLVADWRLASALQGVSILVGIACWVLVPPSAPRAAGAQSTHSREALAALKTPFGLAVQFPAFVRFFIKFAVLSYVPIFATEYLEMSSAEVGLMIGAAAVVAVVAAAATPRALQRLGLGLVLALAIATATVPLVAVPLVQSSWVLVVVIAVSGLGDGALGVLNNVTASLAAPPHSRSAFLGISGSIRNTGKLAAPVALGLLVVATPLPLALALVGVLGFLSIASVPPTVRGVSRRRDDES